MNAFHTQEMHATVWFNIGSYPVKEERARTQVLRAFRSRYLRTGASQHVESSPLDRALLLHLSMMVV